MLKSRIQMLDITYFLIDKYGYSRVNIINPNLDLWLVNKQNVNNPIIRLTNTSLSEGNIKKDQIIKQAFQVSQLLKVDNKVLNIHFNEQVQGEFVSDTYKQTLVNESYVSEYLKESFLGFESSLKPIKDDLNQELKKRELKILDLSNRAKKPRDFSLKAISMTQIIVSLNLFVFLLVSFLKITYGEFIPAVLLGGLYKNFVYGANEWWRIISAGFLHLDIFHILINMLVLLQTGAIVENVYGKSKMLKIYMSSIVVSSMLALIMMDGGSISIGASGGIFGLMGAVVVYLYTSNLYKIPKVRNQILVTLSANLLLSLMPGISFWGHFGGFIGGILITIAVSDSKKLKPAKIHAQISTVMIIVAMFGYSLFVDNNLYNIRPNVDKVTVEVTRELGLDRYADYLEKNLLEYYSEIGEDYE